MTTNETSKTKVLKLIDAVEDMILSRDYSKLSKIAVLFADLDLAEKIFAVMEEDGVEFNWLEALIAVDKCKCPKTATVYYELLLNHHTSDDWEDELHWAKTYGINPDVLHKLYQRAIQETGREPRNYRWCDSTNTLV